MAKLLGKSQAMNGLGELDWATTAVAYDSAALDKQQPETVLVRGQVPGVFAEANSRSISAAESRRKSTFPIPSTTLFINYRIAAQALATLGHRKRAIGCVR